MTSLYHTGLSLGFFSVQCFQTFLSVWLSWMCPWRVQQTTDAAEILPVKVCLIINAGPPHWQNSRLPVDGHHISLTHCHELFSQNMLTYTRIHACTQTHTCKNAHMDETHLQYLSCKHTETQYLCKNIYKLHTEARPSSTFPLYVTLHTHTHTSANTQWIPERTRAICSISYIQCVLTSCQQAVSVFSCQANSPASSK